MTAETVAHLQSEEMMLRYSAHLQIITDNGSENINWLETHMARNKH